MTAYDTTALAQALIGEDEVTKNKKSATRRLRKFLRTDFKAREVETPGKGGRYSIDLNKRDLTAMTKRFKAWEIAQAEEAEGRKKAREIEDAKVTPKVAAEQEADAEETDEVEVEGPTDDEILALLSDDD